MVEEKMTTKLKTELTEKSLRQMIETARQDPRKFGDLYLLYAQPPFDRRQFACHLYHAFTACQGCFERGQRRVQRWFLRQVPH